MKPDRFICTKTGEEYLLDEVRWQSNVGALLNIRFKPSFDKALIRQRSANMWRYREALPLINDQNIVSFGEGATPLQKIDIDGKPVLFKLEFLFPTGSYKDRGTSMLISKIKELGINKVVQDSSGNAGASVAAYCAKAKIACDIYAPKKTSEAKLAQIKMYGANLVLIDGSRQDAAEAAYRAAHLSYYASHVWNPYFFQGTKTLAFEISEQMGWKAPDTLILPAGNGALLIGTFIGFKELRKAGFISSIPKIIAVQPKNCSPLYKAYIDSLPTVPAIETQDTIAEGLAVASPARGMEIIQYVEQTEGKFLVVEEEDIIDTLIMMGQKGYFIEPTSAAVVAGVRQYISTIPLGETVVSVLTGSGLKSTDKINQILSAEHYHKTA